MLSISQVTFRTRASAKIAAIMITANEASTKKYLDALKFPGPATIQNSSSSEDDVVRAVLCLGEIGARKDLS